MIMKNSFQLTRPKVAAGYIKDNRYDCLNNPLQAGLNIHKMALITPLNNQSYSNEHRKFHANLFAFTGTDSMFLCISPRYHD